MKRGGTIAMALLGAALAFAVLGPIGAVLVAWFLASPDPFASTLRGGGVGALGAAGSAAWNYMADEWRLGGPARARRRSDRRQKWHDAGGWRSRALDVEHGLILGWRALVTTLHAVAGAVAAMPEGARAGARAVRARTQPDPTVVTGAGDPVPDPTVVTGASDPVPAPAAGGDKPTAVVHEDCMDYVLEAMGATCPRCGTPWERVEVKEPVDGPALWRHQVRMACPNCGAWRTAHDSEIAGQPDAAASTPTPTAPTPTPAAVTAGQNGSPNSDGQPAAGQATPQPTTGEPMPDTTESALGSGELTNTSDLRAEVTTTQILLEQAELLSNLLGDWQEALPENYTTGAAAGGPYTTALTEAVQEVSQVDGDAKQLGQALNGIRRACDKADSIGQTADALGATGHTKGYANA